MTVITKQQALHYRWGNGCDGWHLVKTKNLSVIQERVPPGGNEVRHFHEQAEQFFYVLTGVATLDVNGSVYNLSATQGFHVAAGVPHRLSNESLEDVEFIVTSTPPSHGDRVLKP